MDKDLIKREITETLSDRNAGGYSRKLWIEAKKVYPKFLLKDDSGEEFDLHDMEREAYYWGLESAYRDILERL